MAKLGTHKPAGPLRGGKGSNFEAGTRIPFIVRWPGQIASGVSAALVSQIDLLASLASLTGQKLADTDAPDSFNVLPAFVGKSPTGREHLVTQSSALALREGSWKYIEPSKGAPMNVQTNTETGNDPNEQLYDLSKDLGERQNVAGRFPDLARQMASRLAQIREKGRSR